MSKPIIEVNHLSKKYRLGEFGARSLREEADKLWHRLRGRKDANLGAVGRGATRGEARDFWALKDVSFTVQPGEVIGIIGRNGAGKSTLLKILSRITEPTEGEIAMRGRVASLLEVGTGFHPELSGRENIYLNGAILGMTKAEIARKFDEIVDFAEVEQFIDTPVKRYSSGMYVRLAFAVAAHLEPEILIIDEVLAVGDQQFQEKCLGKMRDASNKLGRTVLFVSHNLAAVSSLTSKCIYLRGGKVVQIGETSAVLNCYVSDTCSRGAVWNATQETKHPIQITCVSVLDQEGAPAIDVEASMGFQICLEYVVRSSIRGGLVEAYVYASDGTHLVTLGEHDANPGVLDFREIGNYRALIVFPGDLLNLGRYFIRVNAAQGSNQTFDHEDTVSFNIVETRSRSAREGRRGHLVPLTRWLITRL